MNKRYVEILETALARYREELKVVTPYRTRTRPNIGKWLCVEISKYTTAEEDDWVTNQLHRDFAEDPTTFKKQTIKWNPSCYDVFFETGGTMFLLRPEGIQQRIDFLERTIRKYNHYDAEE